MNKVGIWIDEKEAKIVTIDEGNEQFDTISSKVEDYHVAGGSGSRLKGGPQQVVQDSKYLGRKRHQLSAYFQDVISQISNADAIVIFGPAQTGIKFNNELSKKHHRLSEKVRSVEKADSMTDNQIKAWVRNYYNSIN